jgi:hypothetical protein
VGESLGARVYRPDVVDEFDGEMFLRINRRRRSGGPLDVLVVVKVVSMMILTSGWSATMRLAASTPSIPGIRTSKRTMSA